MQNGKQAEIPDKCQDRFILNPLGISVDFIESLERELLPLCCLSTPARTQTKTENCHREVSSFKARDECVISMSYFVLIDRSILTLVQAF